jgi:aerobic-type carbon monoxide dehydrogenase small subunit (CoxS/CutS family)
MDEEKTNEKEVKGLSRREFLKDAGLVVGGTAIGSMAILSACKGETTTVTSTKTVTTTAPGGTSTATVTSPPVTTTVTATAVGKFTDPTDGTEWPSLDALKAHFNTVHPNADSNIVGLNVNGVDYNVLVKPYWSLGHVLRETLGLFGLKQGCSLGECAACTIIVNNKAVLACMQLACEAENQKITTLEGLSNGGVLGPVQQKFHDKECFACGFCTPGFIMAAQALYSVNPKPTMADVRLAMSGHMCMCGENSRHVRTIVGGV